MLAAAATAALVAGTVNGAAADSIGKQKSCGQCKRDDDSNDQGQQRRQQRRRFLLLRRNVMYRQMIGSQIFSFLVLMMMLLMLLLELYVPALRVQRPINSSFFARRDH